MRGHAKASSAAFTEGNGARSWGRTWGLPTVLALAMLICSLTAAPALAIPSITLETATPAYTTVDVQGELTGDIAYSGSYRYQYSTNGVDWRLGTLTNCDPFENVANRCAIPFNSPIGPYDISNEYQELEPNTQYYFRSEMFDPAPTTYSNVVTATTLPVPAPAVLSTNDATEISYLTAKASGTVEGVDSPEGFNADFDAQCRFEHVTDAQFAKTGFESATRVPCSPDSVIGSGPTPVEATLTHEPGPKGEPGLEPNTTYHLRLTVSNAGGSDSQEAGTFTTLPVEAPKVLSVGDATGVAYSEAELSGEIERPANPDPAFDTHCRFEYVSAAEYGTSSETQRLTVNAVGGTYILNLYDPVSVEVLTTVPIRFDASAAELQAALEKLSIIGTGNVSVSGGPTEELNESIYTIAFGGALAGKSVEQMYTDGTTLLPAGSAFIEVQTVTDGHGPEGFKRAISVPCDPETVENPDGVSPILAPVSAPLTGLAPGTTYYYRLIASNAGGSDSKEAVNTFTTLVPGAPVVSILPPSSITGHSAHFSGEINPGGTDPGFNLKWRFRCTPKCPGLQGGTIEADETTHEVFADTTGLRANVEYTVELIASNAASQAIAGPVQFKTDAVGPVATTFPAFSLLGGTKALVGGKVDAENSDTTYWIEYGADESYGSSIPVNHASAGVGEDPVFVTQELEGLQPATTYHFRLVAANSVGTAQGADKPFTTAPAGGLGTSTGKASSLPDNRAWEMVSPPDKNGADIWKLKAQASESGDALTFASQGSFAGQPTAKGGLTTDYLSRRDASGWSTQGIFPPGGLFSVNEPGYHEFSDDLEVGLLKRFEYANESIDPNFPIADPSDFSYTFRHYFRDNDTGSYRIVPEGYAASSSDYSRVVFQRNEALTPDGCAFLCVYDEFGGQLRLASLLPNGENAFGQFSAISKDGSRIYFTSLLDGHLYARVDGSSTVQIDQSERTQPPVGGGPSISLVGIEGPRGERAVFSTAEELVDEDEDMITDLYAWDGTKPQGERLALVSKGDMPGVEADFGQALGSAGDRVNAQSGERGFFMATNQVIAGESGEAGQKIYSWDASGGQQKLDYVATVAPGSLGNGPGYYANVHTSLNGRYLAFSSSERLTAYDNAGKTEVYRYDGEAGQLSCVSCDPEGRAARFPGIFSSISTFEAIYPLLHIARNVTDTGQTFFETREGLVPGDSNGQLDVYEHTGGLPHLISSGKGLEESRFLDASASGDDVFFATTDNLVGWDRGNDVDAYDARVHGGLPEPPPLPIGCDGDSCQPPPNPPKARTPASSTLNGAGNVKQKPAAKKRKKAHKKKKHRSAKRRHGKQATRQHG